MANIVNGAQPVDRKKELYNHVGFNDLYDYNGPILNLFAISKKFFGSIVTDAVKSLANPKTSEERDGTLTFDLELRDKVADDAETPTTVTFSKIPVIEPYDGGAASSGDAASEVERLKEYISLGLYPIVSTPATFVENLNNFEKYDNSAEGSNQIGTVVDVVPNELGGHDAVVLWDPMFTKTTDPSVFSAYRGYVMCSGAVDTPRVWKDDNGPMAKTDVGVPVYRYYPATSVLNTINNIPHMADYLNDAVVTGFLKLGFIDNLMKMNAEAVKTQAAAVQQSIAKTPEPDPEPQEKVPVEDASTTDTFGHRLHLYDADYPIHPDEDYEDSKVEIDP